MTRIEWEKRVIRRMVGIYCRHSEGNVELCHGCTELLEYARRRLDLCPHGEAKPTCRKCTIHCYNAISAERMRRVMRYAGPRMILYAPLTAVTHLWRERSH